jgi:hypothetical protein
VALQHAADKRGTGPWPDLLPALESVAALAFERRPDRFGLVSFTADESGVTATGRGGDDILAWFDGDIAARTSAEIALDGLAAGEPRPQAVTALARRFQRLIED